MNKVEKLSQLLADEKFQDDIKSFGNASIAEQEKVLKKYSITQSELIYARRLLAGLSFNTDKLDSEEIAYSANKMASVISDNPRQPQQINTQRKIFRSIAKVAAVLSIPLLVSTIYLFDRLKNTDALYISQLNKTDLINTVESPAGAKTQVVLPDGSLVWLNAGSSLSYPVVFSGKSRDVELKGEAFFDVVKNKKVPMVLTAGNVKVKVYGTQFNVDAYADKKTVETTLVEGLVTLLHGDNTNEVKLKPGYTAICSDSDSEMQIVKVTDMDMYTGWKDGKLVFRNNTFATIIGDLERWYNVDIQLINADLGKYTLHATFYDESIEQVLDIFSSSIPIRVEYPKRVKQANGRYSKRQIIINHDESKIMVSK